MRPYFAVIKDSFREALHSRVLWIVLILITVFLLASSLLSYRQTLTVGVRNDEIDFPKLVENLKDAKAKKGNRGAQRIYELMSTSGQAAVEKFRPIKPGDQLKQINEFQDTVATITGELQEILKKRDLYQSTSFSTAGLRMEGRELIRREKELAADERERLNRLLLESAFPDTVQASESTSLQLRAAGFDVANPLPISKPLLVTTVRTLLPVLVDKGLLAIGLLIAIIVTAPAIPHTFDPGSLHLLLSKPVARSLLYLSKFLGSCAFVLLCATYLFIGLYFVLGLRWSVWEVRLLWCIPIYTFVFAVYYSVAALAGLIWRNIIVSIIVAICFWALCFTVGWGKIAMEGSMNKYRLKQIVPAGETLIALDETNTPFAWDAKQSKWKIVFLSREMRDFQSFLSTVAALPPMQGPVYDAENERIIGVMVSISNGQQLLATAKSDDGFAYREGPAAPFSPLMLINEPSGQPLLITAGGMYRPQGDLGVQKDEIKVLGYKIPFTTRGPLRDVSVSPLQVWDEPFTATFAPDGTLFTFSRGKLQNFERSEDGKYKLLKTEKFEGRGKRSAQLAAGKSGLLVGYGDGKIEIRDLKSLAVKTTLEPTPGERIIDLAASPDGAWLAALTGDRRLWIMQDGEEKPTLAKVTGQSDVSAIEFTPAGRLLVADFVTRVNEYEPKSWQRTRQFKPPLQFTTLTYHYLINPIYTICPKPGEFYKTVQYLLLDSKDQPGAKEKEKEAENGEQTEPKITAEMIKNPWQPVTSSAIFMAVMLLIGCVYMERQEF